MTPPETTPRPVAFCLHALGSSAREFDALAERLAPELDVVAIDLPGFGDADTADGLTVDDMVRLVTRRIRESGAARWLLVGHSMGGKVASVVASRTLAGRGGVFGLGGVVLLAASPPVPEPMAEERREMMIGWVSGDEGPSVGGGVGTGTLDEAAARKFVDANVGAPLDPAVDAAAVADVRRASG